MNSELIILEQTGSTNTAVKELFSQLNDGSCICALEQTCGRGRLGRKWVTPPGKAVCASAVFKNVSEAYHAGAIIALAALELSRKYLPDAGLFFKWPNDIYIGQSKLAGILSEGVIEKGRLAGVISGIGININQTRTELDQLDNHAVSFNSETGEEFDIPQLCRELFERIQQHYRIYRETPEEIIARWQRANALLGHTLELRRPDGTGLRGKFAAIAPDGAMILERNGEMIRFDCGDVKIDPASLPDLKSPADPNK